MLPAQHTHANQMHSSSAFTVQGRPSMLSWFAYPCPTSDLGPHHLPRHTATFIPTLHSLGHIRTQNSEHMSSTTKMERPWMLAPACVAHPASGVVQVSARWVRAHPIVRMAVHPLTANTSAEPMITTTLAIVIAFIPWKWRRFLPWTSHPSTQVLVLVVAETHACWAHPPPFWQLTCG